MKKVNAALIALLAACLVLLGACDLLAGGGGGGGDEGGDDNPSQYQVAFTVNNGSSSTAYTWPAMAQNVGFAYDSYYGHYYCIFIAEDGYQGENYYYKYLRVYLPNAAAGSYSDSDGVTAITYDDRLGNRYTVDGDYPDTNLNVQVSVDDKGFLHGSFTATLVSPNAYPYGSTYVTLSGTIFSYFE